MAWLIALTGKMNFSVIPQVNAKMASSVEKIAFSISGSVTAQLTVQMALMKKTVLMVT